MGTRDTEPYIHRFPYKHVKHVHGLDTYIYMQTGLFKTVLRNAYVVEKCRK